MLTLTGALRTVFFFGNLRTLSYLPNLLLFGCLHILNTTWARARGNYAGKISLHKKK